MVIESNWVCATPFIAVHLSVIEMTLADTVVNQGTVNKARQWVEMQKKMQWQ